MFCFPLSDPVKGDKDFFRKKKSKRQEDDHDNEKNLN